MEYTKGNWYLDIGDADDATRYYDIYAWVEAESNQYPLYIATVNPCQEVEANARLISACPDMAEALKNVQKLLREQYEILLGHYPKYGRTLELDLIDKALAKAGVK